MTSIAYKIDKHNINSTSSSYMEKYSYCKMKIIGNLMSYKAEQKITELFKD